MSRVCLASAAAAACVALALPARAQNSGGAASAQDDPALHAESSGASPSTGASSGVDAQRRNELLTYRGPEYSLGWRVWAMHVPRFIVTLFTHVEPGWGGGTGIATGPEFVYRNNRLDIAVAAMYVNYNSSPGFFRGVNDAVNGTEQIRSDLFGLYLTSHFLYGFQFGRMFEFQIGAGIGVGYIGGDLFRSQAFQTGSGWQDCVNPNAAPECMNDNNHYTTSNPQNAYREPSIFSGGYVPSVIPWISLPQLAFHVRPHRNVDFKLEGGFALIGFYGGGAVHWVF